MQPCIPESGNRIFYCSDTRIPCHSTFNSLLNFNNKKTFENTARKNVKTGNSYYPLSHDVVYPSKDKCQCLKYNYLIGCVHLFLVRTNLKLRRRVKLFARQHSWENRQNLNILRVKSFAPICGFSSFGRLAYVVGNVYFLPKNNVTQYQNFLPSYGDKQSILAYPTCLESFKHEVV